MNDTIWGLLGNNVKREKRPKRRKRLSLPAGVEEEYLYNNNNINDSQKDIIGTEAPSRHYTFWQRSVAIRTGFLPMLFSILTCARNKHHLNVLEAIYIRLLKPVLCKQKIFVTNLMLFPSLVKEYSSYMCSFRSWMHLHVFFVLIAPV